MLGISLFPNYDPCVVGFKQILIVNKVRGVLKFKKRTSKVTFLLETELYHKEGQFSIKEKYNG